jgi:hypothetical protein
VPRATRSIPKKLSWTAGISSRRASTTARELRASIPPLLPRQRCVSRKAAFLSAYRDTGSIRAAAESAEITPSRHYQWFEEDSAYRRDFAALQELVAGRLQDEAVELAIHGWVEPVYYRGRPCGTGRHYSDRLLTLLLKAYMLKKHQ